MAESSKPTAGTEHGVTADTASRLTSVLLIAAGALLYLSFGYTEMAGSDMWWHVAAGRELFQTGSPWMVDDWSYSHWGGDWLNHEWLSDIVFYSWVSLWGVESLVYWKWLVIVAAYAVLQQVLARESGSQLAGLVCAGVAIAIAAPFLDVRPHIYSLLNFSLLLLLLLRRHSPGWLLVLIFVVWVNLHGGFFFGLMALAILLFPWRDLNLDTLRGAFLLGLLCLVASSLNPSGLKTFLYPLTYAFDASSPYRQLGEWLPPSRPGGIRSPLFSYFMWAPLAALAYLIPAVRRSTGIPWEGLCLCLLTLAMALTSRRFIPLYGMSLALLLAPLLGWLLDRLKLNRLGLVLALVALGFASFRMLPLPLRSGPAFHYLTAEFSYPVDMLNFIESNALKGRVYALYNWGGYIHWRTDGDLKVYIDGRADTVYGPEAYRHYVNVLVSGPDWLESVEATGAQFMLWPNSRNDGGGKLEALLATGRWQPLYQDSVSWLLARDTAELPAQLQASPDTPWKDVAIARKSSWNNQPERALEYAHRARSAIPWHMNACNLLTAVYRQQGDPQSADRILGECLQQFPSSMLH